MLYERQPHLFFALQELASELLIYYGHLQQLLELQTLELVLRRPPFYFLPGEPQQELLESYCIERVNIQLKPFCDFCQYLSFLVSFATPKQLKSRQEFPRICAI